MLNFLVLFLYCFLFIIAAYNLIVQYSRKKLINGFICFQTAFILYYILIPIVIQLLIILYPDQLDGFIYSISHAEPYDVINTYILTTIAYFIIFIVYFIKRPSNITETEVIASNKPTDNGIDYANQRIYRIAIAAGILTLLVGITAELFIADSLGGIFNTIAMGDRLRAFESDRTEYISQSRLFILLLMVSSLASTYFFVYALRIRKRLSLYLLLIASIIASAFYLMFNAGRLGVLLFILTFLIDIAYRKTKHPVIFIGLLLALGMLLLGALDDLFFYLSYGYLEESSTGIISIINEFSFPYLNLLSVSKINEIYGLRWGVDFVSWVINVVPTKILQVFGLTKITSQYTFITEYYSSILSSGGIPTDLLTLGIRQFGILGVLAVSVIFSTLCKYIDKVIDKAYSKKSIFITLRIASIMFIIVPYADLDSFVRSRYDMLMVLFFFIIVSKIQTEATQE